jgi:hypothetical protein
MNRVVISAILFFAALIGMGKVFFMVVGLVLIGEGVVWLVFYSLFDR